MLPCQNKKIIKQMHKFIQKNFLELNYEAIKIHSIYKTFFALTNVIVIVQYTSILLEMEYCHN